MLVFDDKTMLGGGSKADDFEEYFKNPSAYKIVFSFQTLRDSVATVLKYGKTPLFLPDGRRTEASLLEEVQRNGGYREYSVKKIESGYMAERKRDEVSRLSYENFIEILTDAHENNITLNIAISPLHARLLEAMDYRVGLDAAWYEWKKQITAVNEEVAQRLGKRPFRIVDFGLYNEITTQELPKNAGQISPYYWEASHYNARLGDMMLEFLSGRGEHAGLGVEITSKNIDAHVENQKSLRAKFIDTREYRREVFGE